MGKEKKHPKERKLGIAVGVVRWRSSRKRVEAVKSGKEW
jgi:hypothetical protein